MTRSTSSAAAALAFIALWLGASAVSAQEAKQLRIVKQPGLGYLQLIVMREQKLLDERLPGVEIEWRQLTSGPVIRDAMVAGQMDIGSGGVAPFATRGCWRRRASMPRARRRSPLPSRSPRS